MLAVESTHDVIVFGPYLLDRAAGRVLRDGSNVKLRPKTFMLLEHLALRPGQLVSKVELMDAVWPATHVTPSVLAGCVRELRRALGDDARAPRFVETAHRRGYRFIGAPATSAVQPATSTRIVPLTPTSELAELARRFAQAVSRVGRRSGRARAVRTRGPRRRTRGGRTKGRRRLR